jgi:hypothetical protein
MTYETILSDYTNYPVYGDIKSCFQILDCIKAISEPTKNEMKTVCLKYSYT